MPELSIVIPAFNEERRLGKTLEILASWMTAQSFSIDVLIIDDGSSDATIPLVRNFIAAHPGISLKLLQNPRNSGKGAAVRNGVLASTGDWVLFSDADLSTPIEEYLKLRAAASSSGADIIIGSRAVDRSLVGKHQSFARETAGRFFNLLMRLATGLKVRDTQCGFKLMRGPVGRRIFAVQKLDGFSFDVEMLVIASQNAHAIVEVPVRWFNADESKVTLASGLRSFSDLLTIAANRRAGLYKL